MEKENTRNSKGKEGIDPSTFINNKKDEHLDQDFKFPKYAALAAKRAIESPGKTSEALG